ncbi:MAG: PEP-CTERM sorting domain-containing protein [Phycisphaeraceae bacterium]
MFKPQLEHLVMRKQNKSGWIAAALAGLLTVGGTALADAIILVDFGHVEADGAVPVYVDALSQTWNQTTNAQKGTTAADMTALKTITGATTGINLVFNDGVQNWQNAKSSGPNGGGYVEDWYRDFEGDGDGNPATYIPASNGPGTGTAPELAAGLIGPSGGTYQTFGVLQQSDGAGGYNTTAKLRFTDLNPAYTYTVEILVNQVDGSGTQEANYNVNGAYGDAGETQAGGKSFLSRDYGASYYTAVSSGGQNPYGAGRIMLWTEVSPDANGELVVTANRIRTTSYTGAQDPFSVIRLTEVTPLPEPATIGLLALGGAMLLPRRRRRPSR